jgi:uncharacterized protein YecA (UPF0149 family)
MRFKENFMDCQTGKIHTEDQIKDMQKALGLTNEQVHKRFIPMAMNPTSRQLKRGRVGRNELCPCGSGKKFKHCHWTG